MSVGGGQTANLVDGTLHENLTSESADHLALGQVRKVIITGDTDEIRPSTKTVPAKFDAVVVDVGVIKVIEEVGLPQKILWNRGFCATGAIEPWPDFGEFHSGACSIHPYESHPLNRRFGGTLSTTSGDTPGPTFPDSLAVLKRR